MDIKNSVAFVTGANRGIGRAFVEALVEAGAKKIYAAARDTSALADLVAANRGVIVPIALDVTSPEQIREVAARHKDVTLLINNAGIARFAGVIASESLDDARAEMETNYFGTIEMVRAFAPVLAANGGGAMANLASVGAFIGIPALGSYCATKAAVHVMTQAVRAELAAHKTLVVGVYPGPIDTRMAEPFPMDKAPPSEVAEATLRAIAEDREDVYPDDVSAGLRDRLLSEPKAVEREFAAMLPGA